MKIKTEENRKQTFIQMIFWCAMWLVLLHMIVGCGNYKMCLSNTSIDEINETQKLSQKK